MILISQDEKNYINFNNIISINIYKLPFNEKGFKIEAETINDCLYTLGIYDTEERSKEIMNNVIRFECVFRMPKY